MPLTTTLARRVGLVTLVPACLALLAVLTPAAPRTQTVGSEGVTVSLPASWVSLAAEAGGPLWADQDSLDATATVAIYTSVPAADPAAAADLYTRSAKASDPTWVQTSRTTDQAGAEPVVLEQFTSAQGSGALWATADTDGRVVAVQLVGEHVPDGLLSQISASLRAAPAR